MGGKRTRNRNYRVHGEGVRSLTAGFNEIGMPAYRHRAALQLVEEIVAANDADDFYWYVIPSGGEVCGYWDEANRNLLWVNPGEIHVPADGTVTLPALATTYGKQDGDLMGWHLPGGEAGTGSGMRRPTAPKVRCPVTYIDQPAGVACSHCDIVHG